MSSDFPLVIHGDIEAACVDILRSHTLIVNFAGGAPEVKTDLVGYVEHSRRIVVSAEGSSQYGNLQKIKMPRVDIDCYGENRETAHDLAQLAEAILLQVRGGKAYSGNGLTITDVREEMGPIRVPDKESDVMRYYFALRFEIIPYAAP